MPARACGEISDVLRSKYAVGHTILLAMWQSASRAGLLYRVWSGIRVKSIYQVCPGILHNIVVNIVFIYWISLMQSNWTTLPAAAEQIVEALD